MAGRLWIAFRVFIERWEDGGWREQGKREEARELLAPVYGWSTDGFDEVNASLAFLRMIWGSGRRQRRMEFRPQARPWNLNNARRVRRARGASVDHRFVRTYRAPDTTSAS